MKMRTGFSAVVLAMMLAMPSQASEVADLIEKLASHNSAPVIDDGPKGRVRAEASYSLAHQEIVYKAFDALDRMDETSIDELVKHAGDARYAWTQEAEYSRVWQNRRVGTACYILLRRKVTPYGSILKPSPAPDYVKCEDVFTAKEYGGSIEGWWASQRTKKLWEIQLAACKFARRSIEENNPAGSAERELRHIDGLIRQIESEQKPILPGVPFRAIRFAGNKPSR